MKPLSLIALPVAATALVAPAGAVTFDDVFIVSNSGFQDAGNTLTDTVDGVTITATTTDTFRGAETGVGVNSGESQGFRNTTFNAGESVTFSFSDGGTLDSLTFFENGTTQDGTLTLTNTTSGDSASVVVVDNGNVGGFNSTFNFGVDFAAGENLVLTTTNNDTFVRIRAADATIPEPASMALLGAGGVLLLGRRRA